FLLFSIICFSAYSQNITVDELRKEYNKVSYDSATCARLYKKIIKSNNTDIISTAYKGAISAAMANHLKDKKEKLNLFNSGKKLLEQSITADSSNIETRFLRFTIQSNCPKILGYNKQINSDKNFILKNYSSANSVIKKMISSFATKTDYFTEAEKQKLK
ncbi:MAG: hypothetical protein ACXVP4_03360, partial [Bacteroidia bacterium]